MRAADLAGASRKDLAALLARGSAVDPMALAGASYLGRSLGLPRLVERATWTWFRKELVADAEGVRGWNVRVEQEAPHRPRLRDGVPWTFGHFRVRPLRGGESPLPAGPGVLLDYGALRDPVVALEPDRVDLLLGFSYLRVLGCSVPTPSFFTLERAGAVTHVPR